MQVLWSWENLDERFSRITPNSYDYVVGYPTKRFSGGPEQLRWPIWLEKDLGKQLRSNPAVWDAVNRANYITPADRNRSVCLLARSNFDGLRTRILEAFWQIDIHVDCPSVVGNNMMSIRDLGFENKKSFLQTCVFNLCPENTMGAGYVSEKIFEAVEAGSIPIYYGPTDNTAPELAMFNSERIFRFNSSQHNDLYKTAHAVRSLLNSHTSLTDLFSRPAVLLPKANAIIDDFKRNATAFWESVLKRACKKL